MRAALHEWWPYLAETFGVQSYNVGRYAPAELTQMIEVLKDRAEANRKRG